ncbi:putative O-methyltransferase [Rhodocollybia butyracea]|uniref:O-methyltransferase n=1 Tax=Rhodocollybia butyracea TaxID=206335 RepID=A0A9P5PT83_9AGAR|nr:putative O-methyltransferase [Rhodocollybia butyracea]
MTSELCIDAPQHIIHLLRKLHDLSAEQEAKLKGNATRFVSTDVLGPGAPNKDSNFDDLMRDKFIALDEDKCHFVYQLIRATGATNVIEAGTSFGVSTIYLALAVAENKKRLGDQSRPGVIATENEPEKATRARQHWKECGPVVEKEIDLREGNLLETLSKDVEDGVDLLLLDIWTPLALPTLKLIQPKLTPQAVVLSDNVTMAASGYQEFFEYIKAPNSGFRTLTLPYLGGFEMTIYDPKEQQS